MTGYPMLPATASASATVPAMPEGMVGSPMAAMVSLKSSRSSALSMASAFVPMRRTLCRCKKPSLSSSIASVSPVWPPRPARRLSGCSFSMMRLTEVSVSGSR